tara:strand:- start:264 stop:500 length:237 start_codon:yes stop_codon:yes gene_type:complete
MVKIGTELPNGATVLQVKTNDLGDTYVLCLFGAEFVTWWINPDRLDSTSSGHYYNDNLKSALEDLKERSKDNRYEEIA